MICCCDWEENENVWNFFGNLTESQSTVGGGRTFWKNEEEREDIILEAKKKVHFNRLVS